MNLYILKSQVVPPTCPVCPKTSNEPPPPCPPCARCPEPSFECKKVPNYSSENKYLPTIFPPFTSNGPMRDTNPEPILNDFSSF